ncbi:hypothetical protein B0F90DRAFT_397628 [Multifurca ochricompacta]|uniref:Uncharacterized protein n=1 Tax=Multifurca ochricompacta TaxID=376703 RepID=A0AAD4M3I1_9AGAM|nr:hypothetical protein B0F90DRAFT_397628 [Multifurca ochricompacta]
MTSSSQSQDKDALLDKLYSLPCSTGVLQLPGPTHESAEALVEILRQNRWEHQLFFVGEDGENRYNYSTHHVLAIYALGASPEIMTEAYGTHERLKPMVESPEPITDKNYLDHLGDQRYYAGYLAYFSEYLVHHTPGEALEHFILTLPANFVLNLNYIIAQDKKRGGEGKKKHPEMLNRLLAGHAFPFIHLAYGWELGIPGQIAEGLAVAAVYANEQSEVVPQSLFGRAREPIHIMGRFMLPLVPRRTPVFHEKRPTFTLLSRIQDHPKFADDAIGSPGEERRRYPDILKSTGDAITELVNKWTEEWLEGTRNEADVEKRLEGMVEEVIWGNVICFGIGGWNSRDSGQPFKADFSMMSLVTSAYFLLALVLPSRNVPYPSLSLSNRLTLFKAYVLTCAGRYISHGQRGALHIEEFFSTTREQLTAPAMVQPLPFMSRKALSARSGPWERIITNSIVHPDAHLPSTTRALAAFGVRWGDRSPGYFAGGDSGLKDREALDGTLFVRVAGLMMNRLGWAHESGHELGQWDRE